MILLLVLLALAGIAIWTLARNHFAKKVLGNLH